MSRECANSVRYHRQFEQAMLCSTPQDVERWIESEIDRYRTEFHMTPVESRPVIIDNVVRYASIHPISKANKRKIEKLFKVLKPG